MAKLLRPLTGLLTICWLLVLFGAVTAAGIMGSPRWFNGSRKDGHTDSPDPGMMSRLEWDTPETGSAAPGYLLEILEFGGADPETTRMENLAGPEAKVFVKFGCTYKARVAPMDTANNPGTFGPWSLMYSPEMEF